MRWRVWLAAVVLGWGAVSWAQDGQRRFGLADPPPKPEGTIRLTTYNVENLFDEKDDPALSGGLEDIDDAKPKEHIEAVAAAIRRLDPDILALQEVESKEVVLWFRDTFLAGMGYDYVASLDAGDPRGIENAVLSRFPIREEEVWLNLSLGVHPPKLGSRDHPEAGQPLVLKRSPLGVKVEVGEGERLTMFVVHHKSGRDYGYQRTAEAKRVVELAKGAGSGNPEAWVVILGDFNSVPGSEAHQTYSDAGWVDVIPGARTAETTSHSSGRAIDHILVTPSMSKHLAGQGFVLGTVDRPEGADWRTTPEPAGWASDHYPVSVDLRIGKPR